MGVSRPGTESTQAGTRPQTTQNGGGGGDLYAFDTKYNGVNAIDFSPSLHNPVNLVAGGKRPGHI